MRRITTRAALVLSAMALCQHANAHGFAGDHMFISTLLIDDPNVADEASLPTFQFLPQDGGNGQTAYNSNLGIELDKRITENFGFAINYGYSWATQPGNKTANGWNNLVVTPKYKAYVNAEHEFLMSFGVQQMFARTGANGTNGATLGNSDSDTTGPTFYFGKGFGDLPIPALRPLAITGELTYTFADVRLQNDQYGNALNNGNPNTWTGGLSLQYSMRYLASQVKDYGFPSFVNKLTPVAEMVWSSAATSPSGGYPTTYLFGFGVNYTATTYAVSLEALVPGNRATGTHAGFIAQFHLYFDDLFRESLGTPVVDWFKS
jgi:hypothetical protein